MPTMDATVRIGLDDLFGDHHNNLTNTLSRMLEMDVARRTFAQIVDGLPTKQVYDEYGYYHSQIEEHIQICPQAFEALETFLANFSLNTLQFDIKVAHAYQNSVLYSREFKMRFLEMVAIAIHNIGAQLFAQADGGLHQYRHDPEPLPDHLKDHTVPGMTVFFHRRYQEWNLYPQGVADCAGYWSEYQILGGVAIFDRAESDLDCNDAYIDPGDWGYRVFRLSDDQLQQLVDFGSRSSKEENQKALPFPFKAEANARRIDPSKKFEMNIFRNRYELRPPTIGPGYGRRCVHRLEDDPVCFNWMQQYQKERKERGETNDPGDYPGKPS